MDSILSLTVMFGFLFYFALTDIKEKRIPNKGLASFLITGLGFSLLKGPEINTVMIDCLKGLGYGTVFPLLIYLLSKGGIGFGDVKLFGVLGIWFGSYGIICLFVLTFVLGGIFAVFMLIVKKADRTMRLPLAPFILTASILTVLFFQLL